jgi:hypothetical protein
MLMYIEVGNQMGNKKGALCYLWLLGQGPSFLQLAPILKFPLPPNSTTR